MTISAARKEAVREYFLIPIHLRGETETQYRKKHKIKLTTWHQLRDEFKRADASERARADLRRAYGLSHPLAVEEVDLERLAANSVKPPKKGEDPKQVFKERVRTMALESNNAQWANLYAKIEKLIDDKTPVDVNVNITQVAIQAIREMDATGMDEVPQERGLLRPELREDSGQDEDGDDFVPTLAPPDRPS